MRLKISARSSQLARLQAYLVGDALQAKLPGAKLEFTFRESLGDKNLQDPLWKMPEKGVFTEDFYSDLIEGRTDLVVHSWKDLPTEEKPGTAIVATLPRADQRDLLLLKKEHCDQRRVKIFTSSPRREHNLSPFLLSVLPQQPQSIEFVSVRGNVPTRIRKMLENENVHGLVLAKAALDRFLESDLSEMKPVQAELRSALDRCQWMVLPLTINPNAAAQGALAVEVRRDRQDLIDLLTGISDQDTFAAAREERKILSSYGGGCHQKIGVAVLKRRYGDVLFLRGQTDNGETLNARRIVQRERQRSLSALQKWSSASMKDDFKREEIPMVIPSSVEAVFVSRFSAWRDFRGWVWAAGLETWKKLAAKGIWVHGCAEGLGEAEDPRMDQLVGKTLVWHKLTHESGLESKYSFRPSLASYRMIFQGDRENEIRAQLKRADVCYWTSPTHFEVASRIYPEIKSKIHASGPGLTSLYLQDQIKGTPLIFINEEEFWAAT